MKSHRCIEVLLYGFHSYRNRNCLDDLRSARSDNMAADDLPESPSTTSFIIIRSELWEGNLHRPKIRLVDVHPFKPGAGLCSDSPTDPTSGREKTAVRISV
jgi:hypothetical protein